MLPKFFFELDTGDQQIVDRTESDAAKEILNRMPNSAKEFARAVNVTLANQMNKAPDGFRDRTNDIRDNIKQLSETGDVKNLIVEIDLFKTFLQEISDIYSTFRTNALNNTMKEEPFNSMDASVLSQSKQDIFDYLSEAKKEYPAFKEMSDGIIDALKEVNDFDYAKAEIRKPDLTNVVNELTNTIFDNKENIQETEKMLQGLLEKSDSEAKNVEELEKEAEEEKQEDEKATKDMKRVQLKVDSPKVLAEAVNKFEKNLSDLDTNILATFYNNDESTYGSYMNKGYITDNATKKMTPEGIVLYCAIALNWTFPERDNVADDDIDLRLEKIDYNGGASKAVIRYSIPEESKGADFDVDNKRSGGDIDSQWLEARIDPEVKMKNSVGRAELVIRTFDKDDPSKLVTNRGKRTSIVEFVKKLRGEEKKKYKW
jgi:hypothetical protein